MKDVKQTIAAIESVRREKVDPTLKTLVAPGGIDYSGAGLLVQHALAALDEGIPNRQRTRVRLSLFALLEGVNDLFAWAHYNGYFTEPPGLRGGFDAAVARMEEVQAAELRLRNAVAELLNGDSLLGNDVARDLLEKALMPPQVPERQDLTDIPFRGRVEEGHGGEPKGHIFGFMYQQRAMQFVEILQAQGIASKVEFDGVNEQHRVLVSHEDNDRSLELYNELVKEIARGA